MTNWDHIAEKHPLTFLTLRAWQDAARVLKQQLNKALTERDEALRGCRNWRNATHILKQDREEVKEQLDEGIQLFTDILQSLSVTEDDLKRAQRLITKHNWTEGD